MKCRRIRRPAKGGTESPRVYHQHCPQFCAVITFWRHPTLPGSWSSVMLTTSNQQQAYWSSKWLGVQSLPSAINTTATWMQLQAHSKTWQIYHTIARDGKITANEETTQDIDFSGLQDVSDRPGSVAFGILSEFSMEVNNVWSLPYTPVPMVNF